MDEEAGIAVHGHEVLEGEVLGMFETDKPVNDDVSEGRRFEHHLSMEEQAVSAESCEHVVDGAGCTTQSTGDLSVGHATYREDEDPAHEFRTFEPVGGAECLSGERLIAVHAKETLYQAGGFLAFEVTCTAVMPFLGLRNVEMALGVWAVGRFPAGFVVLSVHGLRHGKPEAKDKSLGTTQTLPACSAH